MVYFRSVYDWKFVVIGSQEKSNDSQSQNVSSQQQNIYHNLLYKVVISVCMFDHSRTPWPICLKFVSDRTTWNQVDLLLKKKFSFQTMLGSQACFIKNKNIILIYRKALFIMFIYFNFTKRSRSPISGGWGLLNLTS